MGDTITLDELAQTEVGQEIIRQRNERREAEEALAEERRQSNIAEGQALLAETAPTYLALRQEVLDALAALAPRAVKLAELRGRLKAQVSLVRKAGGPLDGYPEPLPAHEMKKVTEQARDVLSRLGYGL